jgi:hypothetical protein
VRPPCGAADIAAYRSISGPRLAGSAATTGGKGLLSPTIVWVLRPQGQPLNARIARDPGRIRRCRPVHLSLSALPRWRRCRSSSHTNSWLQPYPGIQSMSSLIKLAEISSQLSVTNSLAQTAFFFRPQTLPFLFTRRNSLSAVRLPNLRAAASVIHKGGAVENRVT